MRQTIILLLILIALVACKKEDPKITVSDLPSGNIESGAKIFNDGKNDATACSSCHRTDDTDSTGPSLAGIGNRAGERVEDQSADEYLLESILRPARYLVTGFSTQMPSDYEDKLSAQDFADLIAYLKSL